MYNTKIVGEDLCWLGGSDRRLALFENEYPLPHGVSYNSYLLKDEKTVLLDTVDHAIEDLFFENLEHELDGRELDYLVIHHMEPDHAATAMGVLRRWPNVKIIGNDKTLGMMKQFFGYRGGENWISVKEGDTVSFGRHSLKFVMAPMVHWPEVMMSYDERTKTMFTADAFGTFGALGGSIFADQLPIDEWDSEYRRYYTNIVGKYGPMVQGLLKKAAALDIQQICPLHGPIWRGNLEWLMKRYQAWSTYEPEQNGVVIFAGSVYGNTVNCADVLAGLLDKRGIRNVKVYDLGHVHTSELVAESFRYSHLVFACSTVNGAIFPPMEELLRQLANHGMRDRTVGVIENGTWGPTAGRQMRAILDTMKNMNVVEPALSIRSALHEEQLPQLEQLADAIAASYPMALQD